MNRLLAHFVGSTLVLILATQCALAQQASPPTRLPPPSGPSRGLPPRQAAAVDPFGPGPSAGPARPYAPGTTRSKYPVQQTQYVDPRYAVPQPQGAPQPSPEPSPFNVNGDSAPLLMNAAGGAIHAETPPSSFSGSGAATGSGKPGPKQLEGPQSPTLVIEKVVPAEVQIGKTATFETHVRNVGSISAQDVTLNDEIPHGAQLVGTKPRADRGPNGELVWKLGAIKPGEQVVVECELTPMIEGEMGSVAMVHFAAAASSRTTATRPALAVDVSAPEEVLIGENITYRIKVSNPGTGVATGVVLTNQVPGNLDHPAGKEIEYEIGALRPGESRTLELTMKAGRPGAAANIMVARGDGALQADKQLPVNVTAPALEVALEGSRKRFLDRQATYTVSVANPGTAPAREVELVAYLPPGLEFVDANNQGQFDRQARTVHWQLEELPAQERGTVTMTVLPVESGSQTVKLTSKAQSGLSVEKPEAISVEGVATVLFQVNDLADPVENGGETMYEIHVVNQGTKAAENVLIVATLPGEMKLLSAQGPTRFDVAGTQIRFQELTRLEPKNEALYRLRVQCNSPGDMRVRVQLTSDEIRTPITKEESTRVFADE